MIDLRQLLLESHKAARKSREEAEKSKLGHPRGGSAGAVGDDGTLYGVCPRIAHLRLLGIEKTPELNTEIMWRGGEANETNWIDLLGHGYKGKILRHNECPVSWEIEGIELAVLGTPDVILADVNSKPVMGIELKGIFGTTTAVSVQLDGKPKTENLIQTAVYSHALGIPYALAYTNASWVGLNFHQQKLYDSKHLKPFYKIFYVWWKDEVLYYKDESENFDVKTKITLSNIKDFYKLLFEIGKAKVLPPRPNGTSAEGKAAKWSPCGLCDFRDVCDKSESNYDNWIQHAKEIVK